MNDPICDIHNIRIHHPLYYTQQFLTNEYVIANHLAKHIHLFDCILRPDYHFFNELRGNIHLVKEHNTPYQADQIERSGPYETTDTCYTFDSNKQLLQLTIQQNGEKSTSKEEVYFLDSLQQPHTIKTVKSIDGIVRESKELQLSRALEYEGSVAHFTATNETKQWKREGPPISRYGIRTGQPVQKIHNRTNTAEQTKATITYNDAWQIVKYQAFSQKNKTELVYEAVFRYDGNQVLQQITYTRYPPAHPFSTDVLFEYDSQGFLVNCMEGPFKKSWQYDKQGNPVYYTFYDIYGLQLFESILSYTYDSTGNWITRTKSNYRVNKYNKTKFEENDTERVIAYY